MMSQTLKQSKRMSFRRKLEIWTALSKSMLLLKNNLKFLRCNSRNHLSTSLVMNPHQLNLLRLKMPWQTNSKTNQIREKVIALWWTKMTLMSLCYVFAARIKEERSLSKLVDIWCSARIVSFSIAWRIYTKKSVLFAEKSTRKHCIFSSLEMLVFLSLHAIEIVALKW